MANENETLDPIRQSVRVDCPVEDAFRLFTEYFPDVEPDSVTLWDPPRRIEFVWRPAASQSVNVEFDDDAGGTRVTLTHHGWQHAGVPTCLAQAA